MSDVPAHWLTYCAVSDLDETLATARQLGGQVVLGPIDTPGDVATVADPHSASVLRGQQRDPVHGESIISRHQCQPSNGGLRDQHPVDSSLTLARQRTRRPPRL